MGMIWYVAFGSALGGVARYLAGTMLQRLDSGAFPVGTLAVNISGSFLLGIILRYAIDTPSISPEMRAFLAVGFCGGYTTFSAFSFETARLLEAGEWIRAATYVGLSVLLSLAAMFLGFATARQVVALRFH